MENPNTWTIVERTINDEMQRAEQDHQRGVIGLSTPRRIADALRKAGLIKE